jgi:hypothetical protein
VAAAYKTTQPPTKLSIAVLPLSGVRLTLYRTTINLVRKPEAEIQAALEAAAAAAAPAATGKGGKAAAAGKGKKGTAEEPSIGEIASVRTVFRACLHSSDFKQGITSIYPQLTTSYVCSVATTCLK